MGFGFSTRSGGATTLRETTQGLQGIASKFLDNQQRDHITRKKDTMAKADAKGKHRYAKLQQLGALNLNLETAQETRAAQAADMHRAADTVEKFGDLGDLVSWVGRWVRWVIRYAGEWFAWFCGSVCIILLFLRIENRLLIRPGSSCPHGGSSDWSHDWD
jgi:hypothetical protein